VLSSTPAAKFTGLTPASAYDVVVAAKRADGTWVDGTNTLGFVTAAPGWVVGQAHLEPRARRSWPASAADSGGGDCKCSHRSGSCPACPSPCRAPSLDGIPTSPFGADLTVTPPAVGGPYPKYEITLCPLRGGECIKATCTTLKPGVCEMGGLTPDTTYVATVGMGGVGWGGSQWNPEPQKHVEARRPWPARRP
jgi:hypothetical protein